MHAFIAHTGQVGTSLHLCFCARQPWPSNDCQAFQWKPWPSYEREYLRPMLCCTWTCACARLTHH